MPFVMTVLVPGDPTINDHLGDALWKAGRKMGARFQWDHALNFGPDEPFPIVDAEHPVDGIVKLLSKSNPAVLVREKEAIRGIVTRSDMLHYVMAR